VTAQSRLAGLINDDTSLMAMRLILFSLFPLVMAVRLVHRQRVGLTRLTLKMPFYSQCYVAAPFALLVGLAATVDQTHWAGAGWVTLTLLILAFLWYSLVQARWFADKLATSFVRGLLHGLIGIIEGIALMALILPLFV
jgi:hypothetical protein